MSPKCPQAMEVERDMERAFRESITMTDIFDPATEKVLYTKISRIDHNGTVYFGMVKGLPSHELTLPQMKSTLKQVADVRIYPTLEAWMHVACLSDEQDISTIEIKRPEVQRLDKHADDGSIPSSIMNEVRIMEMIKHHPHPRFVPYYGVDIKRDDLQRELVTGILLEKYDVTLAMRQTSNSKPLNVEKCMRELREAVHFLHEHNLAHNNITAQNVGIGYNDRPVVLNFSCAGIIGEKISRGGTTDVNDPEYGESSARHDDKAMDELEIWLKSDEARRGYGMAPAAELDAHSDAQSWLCLPSIGQLFQSLFGLSGHGRVRLAE